MKSVFAFVALFPILIMLSCEQDPEELLCELSFPVSSLIFYEGCLLPISIQVRGAENIQLSIDHKDMGSLHPTTQVRYWDTEGYALGEHLIKVSCTAKDGEVFWDEKIIELSPICVDCPDSVSDVEGNLYSVVQIGNQCWMGENLRVRHFPDGTPLKNGNSSQGDSLSSPTYTELPEALTGWYFSYEGDSVYSKTYGYLYTWATVVNGSLAVRNSSGYIQGIAPDGWHIPEVEEWRTLIDYLGGVEIAGSLLKTGAVEGVFDALPGGSCLLNFAYLDGGEAAYFWTATPTIVNHAYHIFLPNRENRVHVLGHQDSKRYGYSLRCLMN